MGKMSEAERVGEIFDADVVGNDELFQAGMEGFAEGGIGFDPEGVGRCPDPTVGLQFPFGGDDGGTNGLAGLKFF